MVQLGILIIVVVMQATSMIEHIYPQMSITGEIQ